MGKPPEVGDIVRVKWSHRVGHQLGADIRTAAMKNTPLVIITLNTDSSPTGRGHATECLHPEGHLLDIESDNLTHRGPFKHSKRLGEEKFFLDKEAV